MTDPTLKSPVWIPLCENTRTYPLVVATIADSPFKVIAKTTETGNSQFWLHAHSMRKIRCIPWVLIALTCDIFALRQVVLPLKLGSQVFVHLVVDCGWIAVSCLCGKESSDFAQASHRVIVVVREMVSTTAQFVVEFHGDSCMTTVVNSRDDAKSVEIYRNKKRSQVSEPFLFFC